MLCVTSIYLDTEPVASADLLQRAQAGDTEAFCRLCRPHEAPLLRQACLLCGDAGQAEDLSQETLIEAWKCLGRYNGRCRLFTWLCAILLNRYRNFRRRKIPAPLSALAHGDDSQTRQKIESLADAAAHPDQVADRNEQYLRLRTSIAKLSHKHREIIHLRFFVDDSLEGIAVALNRPIGTIKSRLFHALERLREIHPPDGKMDL